MRDQEQHRQPRKPHSRKVFVSSCAKDAHFLVPALRHLEALAPAVDVLHAGKAEVGTHVPTAIRR